MMQLNHTFHSVLSSWSQENLTFCGTWTSSAYNSDEQKLCNLSVNASKLTSFQLITGVIFWWLEQVTRHDVPFKTKKGPIVWVLLENPPSPVTCRIQRPTVHLGGSVAMWQIRRESWWLITQGDGVCLFYGVLNDEKTMSQVASYLISKTCRELSTHDQTLFSCEENTIKMLVMLKVSTTISFLTSGQFHLCSPVTQIALTILKISNLNLIAVFRLHCR